MKYKLSNYTIITDVINEGNEYPERIIFATRTGSTLKIKDSLFQRILSNSFLEIDFDTLQLLINSEIIIPQDTVSEFEDILKQNILDLAIPKALSFTIQPTADCQFGCNYCGQKHVKHSMPDNIATRTIDRIEKKIIETRPLSLSITWYGGEPLMGLKQIKKISIELIKLAEKYKISYFADMITNGLSFKKQIFKDLVNICKITRYQVTLDGTAEFHNKRRIIKGGGDTFDIIFKNLVQVVHSKEYSDNQCSIVIRMNIDKRNFHSITNLVDLLAENKFYEKKVNLNFEPVVSWGDKKAKDSDSFEPNEFASKEIDLILYAREKGFKNFELPQRTTAPCMVVEKNSEVIDAFGNLFPCYEMPITPKYDTNEYRIGNILFDEKTYNLNAKTRNWNEDIKSNISGCPSCKLFPVCGGGCPKQWYNGEKGCPSFKYNIQDRLVLDYLIKKEVL